MFGAAIFLGGTLIKAGALNSHYPSGRSPEYFLYAMTPLKSDDEAPRFNFSSFADRAPEGNFGESR